MKKENMNPLMVLGTSSGVGKSLISVAICRLLRREGLKPIPFKGQNMSNNAWVDKNGGEMAYSQALQAWAAGLEPCCEMNPILLKPKGNCTSEVIHLGKSVGYTEAISYYEDWYEPGWDTIKRALKSINSDYKEGKLIIEGAGSPVEVNIQHRDLTNLKIAKYLKANCLLVADIEKGGVFAQIVGTLALLKEDELSLIKGLVINRFRGDLKLFDEGVQWLEKETGIPVLGVIPWLEDIFPPEDSLDLLERNRCKPDTEIEVVIIKTSSISNFSDFDPLESEKSVKIRWVKPGENIGHPDCLILPGSKQTLKDLQQIYSSGLGDQIIEYSEKGGNIFGICGGMQILGTSLKDPLKLENSSENISKEFKGLQLLPIRTIFQGKKELNQISIDMLWPNQINVKGFELHYGESYLDKSKALDTEEICIQDNKGWIVRKSHGAWIAGTYLHGIFENDAWRRSWLNLLRAKKGLPALGLRDENYLGKRELLLDKLAEVFESNSNLKELIRDGRL